MIELQHLTKRFATQGGTVIALNDINLTIQDGDVYGIIGMSGAGKSTLVRCINMLERPDEGKVIVNGKQMQELNAADLRAARREITMIFQQFNLLMQRTCLRNIMFPMELAKVPKEKAEARARELLELVGLPDRADAYPAQLSGGQKQRIAIARALATDPKVLLCDEATSALDPNTTHAILQLIQNLTAQWCFFRLQCVFHCFVHVIGKEMIRLDAHVFYIFCDCIYIDRSHLYPPGDMGFFGTLCSCSKKPVLFYFTLFQDDIQVFFAVV